MRSGTTGGGGGVRAGARRWDGVNIQHWFQPIVDLTDNEPIGYEALLRPGGGSPAAYLTAVRAAGSRVCRRFDAASISVACHNAQRWIGPKRLFVNVTESTVRAAVHQGWPDTPGGLNVVWEIPETEGAVRELLRPGTMERLTADGVEIAMDDLGAGWADLHRIAIAGPNCWLKVDRAIVAELPSDRAVAVLQAMAQASPRVVAEGIETPEQLRLVRAAGIRYGQGFLLDAIQQVHRAIPIRGEVPG